MRAAAIGVGSCLLLAACPAADRTERVARALVAPEGRRAWWSGHGATPCEAARRSPEAQRRLLDIGWSQVINEDFDGYGEADWSTHGEYYGGGPLEGAARWATLWSGCSGPCGPDEGVHVRTEPGPGGDLGGVLHQQPAPPQSEGITRSSLLVSAQTGAADLLMEVDRRTVRSLREGAPNNWETAWLFFRYSAVDKPMDDLRDPAGLCGHQRGYYLALKPGAAGGDHWELGKLGPGYQVPGERSGGCQRFLASGRGPVDRGEWQRVCLAAVGNQFAMWVDGDRLAHGDESVFADSDDRTTRHLPCPPEAAGDPRCAAPHGGAFPGGEELYGSGAVGLYNEDAHVDFDNVSVWARLRATAP